MAGDWIKMRSELQTHPKIVRILSATDADKFRVIGGLHAVWSVFDAHSSDGVLIGYTADLMDHIIGWRGFSQAMIDVGWLEQDTQGLVLPEFDEHNSKSAKRRAEDQKRKKSVRKMSASCPQSKRTKSGLDKREDSKPLTPLPDGLNSDAWKRWEAYRTEIRKPIKPASILAAQRKLAEYGATQSEVVEQSIANGWQGLFPLKVVPLQDNKPRLAL